MADLSMRPRYSEEEFARRGDEIYDRDILPKLKPDDKGIVAISGIINSELEAIVRLWIRGPVKVIGTGRPHDGGDLPMPGPARYDP
jgi:hypothetical protein